MRETERKIMNPLTVSAIGIVLYCTEVRTQDQNITVTGIAGITVNTDIRCSNAHDFWMINGSVYGLLHVPNEFVVCSEICGLDTLTIPVVQSEMDDYIFQCVGIDYNTNTHHLGRQTELSVITLPQNGSFNVTLLDTVRRDVLELHYPQLSVGPVNTSIGWTYSNLTCQPSVFTIEGYDAISDPLQLSSPPLTLTSTSSVLTFPTSTIHHNITHASFYLRLLAHDVSGTACAQDSAFMYYHLNNKVLTPVPISPSPDGEGCVPIPVELSSTHDSSSLEVVWPERHDTVGRLCYCPPFEGTLGLFTRCISTTSCHTDYSISVRNNSVCFAGPSPQLTNIPVYFTLLESCDDRRCVIRSIVTSFMIVFAPPPPPVVYSTNTSVCFWSRSPVESYLVTVTDVSGTNTSLSGTYNTSQCLPITSDLYPDVCGPFMASVVAVNRAGTSNSITHQIITESDFSFDSLLCFQIREISTTTTTTITTANNTNSNTSTGYIILGISLGGLFLILLLLLPVIILCFFYKRKMFKNTLIHHPSETVRTERLYQEVTHDTVYSIVRRSLINQPPTENVQLNHFHEVPQGTTEPLPEAASPDITIHPQPLGVSSELETTYDTLQYTIRASQEDTDTPVDTQGLYDNTNTSQVTPQALYGTLGVSNSFEHRIVNGCVYAVVTKKLKPKTVTVDVTDSMAEGTANDTAEGITNAIPKLYDDTEHGGVWRDELSMIYQNASSISKTPLKGI